jgi:hypothetical protein
MRIRSLLSAVAIAVVANAAFGQPSLPPLPSPPTSALDVDAQTTRLTQRYRLSSEQATQVRTILAEQGRKADEVLRQQLPPEQAFARLKSIKDEEASRVDAVLTPEQRRSYGQDAPPGPPALATAPAAR